MTHFNKFTLIICIGTIITTITFLYNSKMPDKDMEYMIEKTSTLEQNMKLLYKNNLERIDTSFVRNMNDSTFSTFAKRVKNSPQIILLIPEDPCESCLKDEYELLNKMPQYIQNNITLLTHFSSIRDANIFIKNTKLKYPIYNTQQNSFIHEISNRNKLVLFVLGKNLIPIHLFIPISFLPEINIEYHDFLLSIFKDENPDIIDNNKNLLSKITEVTTNKLIHDFHNIKKGHAISTTFEIKNTGTNPFIITKIDKACGCTAVEWKKEPIYTNEIDTIKIQFDANQSGPFIKKIFVFSNIKDSPMQFTIKGVVKN